MENPPTPAADLGVHDDLAILTLDLNALSEPMTAISCWEIDDAIDRMSAGTVRAVVLRGRRTKPGDHTDHFPGIPDPPAAAATELSPSLPTWMGPLCDIPVPVVAVLEGSIAGTWLGLSLCADIRIAAPTTTLTFPDLDTFGPAHQQLALRIAGLIGPAKAKMVVLGSPTLDCTTAHSWGVIDRIEHDPLDGALAQARSMIRGIAP